MELSIILILLILNCYKVWAQINGEKEQTLLPTDNQEYDLSLIFPDSQHTETVNFEPANGHPNVKGSIDTYYAETMSNLVINYVADKNGYRASYKITKRLPLGAVKFETRLSANTLKTLAG